MELLRVQNLTFSYPESLKKAINDISFTLNKGDFILLCGKTSSGKTTLLKLLKPSLKPKGNFKGNIYYNSKINDSKIGFVMQNPENQIVSNKVWRELSFGLENHGVPSEIIKRKVAEISSYFGINHLFERDVNTLSGGQLQLINLASVLAMSPDLLLLDEPTSQLDPISATNFINTLKRINSEFGITVIISEHKIDELFSLCNKVLYLEDGRKAFFDTQKAAAQSLELSSLPAVVRIGRQLGAEKSCPLNVKETKQFIEENFNKNYNEIEVKENITSTESVINLKNIWFKFSKESNDVLKGLDLKVKTGECFCILGANGSGKTTLLKVISGLIKAYFGTINIFNKKIKDYNGNSLYQNNLAYLPQNPIDIFIKDNIIEDFKFYCNSLGYNEKLIEKFADKLKITNLLNKHPFDLSGGELQKCAIAKILLSRPKILLLDEPTKGIDDETKDQLFKILKELKDEGITILMATHDVEFAAISADRCGLLFNGEIISISPPHEFFSSNSFYTTTASKISRGIFKNTITIDEVIQLCKLNGKRTDGKKCD